MGAHTGIPLWKSELLELDVRFLESRYTYFRKTLCEIFIFKTFVVAFLPSRNQGVLTEKFVPTWTFQKKLIGQRWLFKAPNPSGQEQRQLLEVFYKISLLPVTWLKKRLQHIFSWEFCQIFKNTFFTEHRWATSGNSLWQENLHLFSLLKSEVAVHWCSKKQLLWKFREIPWKTFIAEFFFLYLVVDIFGRALLYNTCEWFCGIDEYWV